MQGEAFWLWMLIISSMHRGIEQEDRLELCGVMVAGCVCVSDTQVDRLSVFVCVCVCLSFVSVSGWENVCLIHDSLCVCR